MVHGRSKPRIHCKWIPQTLMVSVTLVVGTVSSLGISITPVQAQLPELGESRESSPEPLPLEQLANIFNLPRSSFETGAVRLDGRRLFLVAVAVTDAESTDDTESPSLQRRIQSIEDSLHQLARQRIPHDELAVEATVDSETNQYIITVNGQYLMTVTFLDAQAQGLSPQIWAEQLTHIIVDTLIQFQEERTLEVFTEQALKSAGLLLLMLILNQVINWGEAKLQLKREKVRQRLTDLTDLPDLEAIASLNSTELSRLSTAKWDNRQQQLDISETRFELVQRSLLLLQIMGWVSTASLVVGFFPQTRWIQSIILAVSQGTILGLVLLGGATYGAIRLTSAGIDQLFTTLRQGRWWKALHSPNHQRLNKRMTTLAGVVKKAAAVVISAVALTVGMTFLGVSITAIIASFSVIGLGISLAAQDLIRDVINGILILTEDQYAEGDWIKVGDKDGVVELITLRITQLRNMEGNLITIPNSTIKAVENLSNGWSRVNLGIEVPYDTNVDHAIEVIESVAVQMTYEQAWGPMILDAPQVLGVDDFNQHSLIVRLWIKVQPMTQWIVGREYRRRLRFAFEENGIHVAYPHQYLWFKTPLNLDQGSLTSDEIAQLKSILKTAHAPSDSAYISDTNGSNAPPTYEPDSAAKV